MQVSCIRCDSVPRCDTLYALRVEPKVAPQWHQEGAQMAPHKVEKFEMESERKRKCKQVKQ